MSYNIGHNLRPLRCERCNQISFCLGVRYPRLTSVHAAANPHIWSFDVRSNNGRRRRPAITFSVIAVLSLQQLSTRGQVHDFHSILRHCNQKRCAKMLRDHNTTVTRTIDLRRPVLVRRMIWEGPKNLQNFRAKRDTPSMYDKFFSV